MTAEASGPNAADADVVRLITRLNIGGPARQALLLTRELRDEFPTMLAAGRPDATEGELSDPAVQVHRVPLVRPVAPASDAAALRVTRALLRRSRPRILHTHMAKAGTVGRLAALSLGAERPKLVHTFHGHVLEGYFDRATQRAFVEAERWLARRTDALVAVSPQIRDQLLDIGIGQPSQFHVISLGLDLGTFLAVRSRDGRFRRELGVTPTAELVGMVGRLVPIKAVDVALEAIARLDDVHFAIVGDGVERAPLEALARDRGLAHRVHFTGWRADLAVVLSDLDAVLLTSRNEGTPVALIEALAAARPVIATDVGGVRHVVDDAVTGYLARDPSPAGIASTIRQCLDDPRRSARMAQAGRDVVRVKFGSERLVDDIRSLYRELVARAPHRPAVGM